MWLKQLSREDWVTVLIGVVCGLVLVFAAANQKPEQQQSMVDVEAFGRIG